MNQTQTSARSNLLGNYEGHGSLRSSAELAAKDELFASRSMMYRMISMVVGSLIVTAIVATLFAGVFTWIGGDGVGFADNFILFFSFIYSLWIIGFVTQIPLICTQLVYGINLPQGRYWRSNKPLRMATRNNVSRKTIREIIRLAEAADFAKRNQHAVEEIVKLAESESTRSGVATTTLIQNALARVTPDQN